MLKEIKNIIQIATGYLTVIKIEEDMKATIDVFTVDPIKYKISEKIKKSFDPNDEFPWDIKKGLGGIFDLELLGQGCTLLFGIESYDVKTHLSHLPKLEKWSKFDSEKMINLYGLMTRLLQVFALIGSYKDLNNLNAKFTHNLILRETGIDCIENLKKELDESRRWALDVITKKLK